MRISLSCRLLLHNMSGTRHHSIMNTDALADNFLEFLLQLCLNQSDLTMNQIHHIDQIGCPRSWVVSTLAIWKDFEFQSNDVCQSCAFHWIPACAWSVIRLFGACAWLFCECVPFIILLAKCKPIEMVLAKIEWQTEEIVDSRIAWEIRRQKLRLHWHKHFKGNSSQLKRMFYQHVRLLFASPINQTLNMCGMRRIRRNFNVINIHWNWNLKMEMRLKSNP